MTHYQGQAPIRPIPVAAPGRTLDAPRKRYGLLALIAVALMLGAACYAIRCTHEQETR